MSRSTKGWVFVVVQVVLLASLVVLPGRDDWATPALVQALGIALVAAGLVFMLVAARFLGRSLTATPVPVAHGELATTGAYRFVRHPIYTGVIAVVVGLTVRSGSWAVLTVAAVTLVFFNVKARWEEAQLAERYDGYADYAARTPRFIPRPGIRR